MTAAEHLFTNGDAAAPDEVDGKAERKSASTVLVETATELYDFAVSDAGDTFGVPRTGPKVVRLLRGGKTSLRAELSREYFRRAGKAAPQQALADALLVIEGMAQDGEEHSLALRVARHEGVHWLDLGDATGRAVRITADGWRVEDRAPVLFRRTSLNAALPEPVTGGTLAELWAWLNASPQDRPLVAAWLVGVLFPDMPHAVLSLFGEQGTGKSTAVRVLVSLLDPSPVPLRKPPRDADSWVTAAAGSWVVGLDNLSDIPPWLSDSMCRAVTGDGDVRRRLYTDGELAVFAFRRCLILNGIDVGAIRGDLAERMLPIELHTITEQTRREEEDLWPAWQRVHPRLLGAVLDLAAGVLRALPSVRLERKPRMADFARILAAVDAVLGTDGLPLYLDKQGRIAADTLSGDPFLVAAAAIPGTFTGTAVELLDRVALDPDKRPPKGWPSSARAVTQLLKRQAPTMRKAGWVIEHDDGANHDKVTRWTITPPARREMARNRDPQDPQDPRQASDQHKQRQDGAGHAGQDAANAGQHTRNPRSPAALDPRLDGAITAGQRPAAGHAGHAGQQYGQSHDDVTCGLCGTAIDAGDVCGDCAPVLSSRSPESCRRCGDRLPPGLVTLGRTAHVTDCTDRGSVDSADSVATEPTRRRGAA